VTAGRAGAKEKSSCAGGTFAVIPLIIELIPVFCFSMNIDITTHVLILFPVRVFFACAPAMAQQCTDKETGCRYACLPGPKAYLVSS